ncbi:MAG: hypothetical protein ACI9CD_000538 [Candidatus Deianiraeaceae bacterium]|jgi:hypothetical protein
MGKSIKILLYFLTVFCVYQSSSAMLYHDNPEINKKILDSMEKFCTDAGGLTIQFEDACANSCILYDRHTGEEIEIMRESCEKKKIYSCQCPQKQCLKDRKCQNIIEK